MTDIMEMAAEQEEVREPQFKLIRFHEIRARDIKPYLVKGLIPRIGLTVIWGPPKCGKSFWTFDLMMHVALGREYRGRRVRQGPVVYIALEGLDGVQRRAEAFRQRNLAEDHTEGVPFFLIGSRLDLAEDHCVLIECIKSQIGEILPVAVVI